jgi:hypothetical protein
MMKNLRLGASLFVLLFMASLPCRSLSADERIDKIRELYQRIQELDCGDVCAHFKHEIVYNTMLPAIGLQTTAVQFFYFSGQLDPETDPYLLTHELKKVKVTYNIAASAYYTIEYLYDENGDLVFYYWREETAFEQNEKRFYFYNKKLLKVAMDYTPWEGDRVKYEDVKNFKKEDVQEATWLMQRALDYKTLFETLIAAEQWK